MMLTETIKDQTMRAIWEVRNVINCVPDEIWNKTYSDMPCWKHIYHMLHSLDLWFINPRDRAYCEPKIHEVDLNDLNKLSPKTLSREEIMDYMSEIEKKITKYVNNLDDLQLCEKPENCEYSRFTLILAQFRHLHTHMGLIMGFLVTDKNLWPRVLGLEGEFPGGEYERYF